MLTTSGNLFAISLFIKSKDYTSKQQANTSDNDARESPMIFVAFIVCSSSSSMNLTSSAIIAIPSPATKITIVYFLILGIR